jgi:hypothetical protein
VGSLLKTGYQGDYEEMNHILIKSEDSKEIMRITRDGIWVDPEVEPTITASQVLNVMDGYIKTLCDSVWNDAIDAVQMRFLQMHDHAEASHNYWHHAANEMEDLKK